MSRNTSNLVERSTVNTNDILVLGEKINDSLVVSEGCFNFPYLN